MAMRYAEKFENISGSISYVFLLNKYEWDSSQQLNTPVSSVIGADFQHDSLGTAPGLLIDAQEVIRCMPVLATPALAEAERDNMVAKLWRIGRGKLYVLNSDGSRYWAYGRIANMTNITVIVGMQRHFAAVATFRRSSLWMDTAQTAPSATVISSSPTTFTVNNTGNYPVKNAIIRLRSNSGSGWASPILVENLTTNESFSIANAAGGANDEIKIDCGAMTVLKSTDDGATYPTNLWPSTTLGAQSGLMTYDVGNNSIRVTSTGASLNFETTFYAPR